MKSKIYLFLVILLISAIGQNLLSQTLQWSQTYNAAGPNRDNPNSNVIDASGNCYVIGNKYISGFNYDFVVIKYNPVGVEEWVRIFDGSEFDAFNDNDDGKAIKVGSDGNIYAAGNLSDTITKQNCSLIKITPDGYVSWSVTFNFSGTNYDYINDILVDVPNGIYAAGHTYDWLSGNDDALTIKFDTSGNVIWAKNFDSSDTLTYGNDDSKFIAKDNAGFIYTGGYTHYDTDNINFLKYSPDGELIHSFIFDDLYADETLYKMKMDNSGNIYAVGKGTGVTMIIIKLDSSLSLQWTDTTSYGTFSNDHAEDLSIDVDGNIYVCGTLAMDSGLGYFLTKSAVLKYSSSGSLLWMFTHISNSTSETAIKIIASNDGTVFVLGSFWTPSFSTSHLKVMRLDSAGNLIDSIFYNGSGTNNMSAKSFSIDENNSLFISLTRNSLANSGKIVTLKYSNPLLPVELTSFNYERRENNVVLKWSTSSELNNIGFDIERKDNKNDNWKKIDFIAGHGNSITDNSYSYRDNNLISGKYSYRLKQIDYNGNNKYYYLNTEVVIGAPQKFVLHQNYPNPFNPTTMFNFEIPEDGFVTLKVYDMSGREVISLVNTNLLAGYHSLSLNASKFNLSSGVYFYKISSSNYSAIKKMVLLK